MRIKAGAFRLGLPRPGSIITIYVMPSARGQAAHYIAKMRSPDCCILDVGHFSDIVDACDVMMLLPMMRIRAFDLRRRGRKCAI